MAVGLERTHAEFGGQGKGLAVVGFGRHALQRFAPCRNVAEEAQGIRLVTPFLVRTGKRQRPLGEGVRLLQAAGQEMRLPQGETTEHLIAKIANYFRCNCLLQPLREQGDLVTDFSGQMSYCEVQKLFDTIIPFGQHRCYWKSHFLADLQDSMIDQALDNAAEAPSDSTLSSLWNFGGATAAVPAEATALGDRSMGWMYSIDSIWNEAAEDAANITWTRKVWEQTRKFSQEGRLYLNFAGHGEDGVALVKDAYGKNYARLAAIKAKYDPSNLFRFNQNICPAA